MATGTFCARNRDLRATARENRSTNDDLGALSADLQHRVRAATHVPPGSIVPAARPGTHAEAGRVVSLSTSPTATSAGGFRPGTEKNTFTRPMSVNRPKVSQKP